MSPEIVLSGNTASGLIKPAGGFPSRAYVTFLVGNGDYVKGVVGLAKGLRKVNTAYPLVVAVLPDVPEEHRRILESQGCIVKEIEPVYPPENQTQFAMAYSKFRIWNFDDYSKVIYLDADTQVLDNIDNLFDYPDGYFYAVMDCFCEKEWSHTPQYKIGYCQLCPDRVEWPTEEMGPAPPLYFNAGMFVYEPSKDTCKALLDALKTTPPTPFAEQDYLNMFFKDKYLPLSPIYNHVLPTWGLHPESGIDINRVKVFRYRTAGSKPWRFKPWRFTGDLEMLVKKWRDVYNDESLDYKPPEPVSLQPLIKALSEAGTVHYITAPSAA